MIKHFLNMYIFLIKDDYEKIWNQNSLNHNLYCFLKPKIL
jgi:hypothetical protein